jgi:hypothetical protein
MSPGAARRRRMRSRVLPLIVCLAAAGCGSSSWNWAQSGATPPREWSPFPDHASSDNAFAVVVTLAFSAVVAIGAATIDACKHAFHELALKSEPGVAYDSPEGRALRIPNYPPH